MKRFALALCAAVAMMAPAAKADLIGYYTFEGNINDVSGNGNHGSFGPVAPTLTGNGYQGSAYQFGTGGTNTFITLPIDINPGVMPQVTFGAWVNADLNDLRRGIISQDTGNYDRTLDLDDRGPSSAASDYCVFAGPVTQGICSGAATTNQWVFLAARYNATTGDIAITVNGTHTTGSGLPENNGTSLLYVGRNPTFDLPFAGRIDNVFVFNEYLTNAQLDDIRRNGIDTVPEPSTMLLMSGGLGAAVLLRRLKARS